MLASDPAGAREGLSFFGALATPLKEPAVNRDRSPISRHEGYGVSQAALGAGVAVMVICCAGPVLVAAGALGVIGRLVGNPVVVLAAVAAVTAVVMTVLRRHDRSGDAVCCPPGRHPQDTGASRPGGD